MSAPEGGDAEDGLRVVVEQMEPALGRPERNGERIREAAGAGEADVVVFPELALTGYDLRAHAPEVAVPEGTAPVEGLEEDGPLVVVGYVEEDRDHRLYNVAGALRGRKVVAVHRKLHLPTYGMFDEGRHFTPGQGPLATFPAGRGWRAGLLVCEDLWHPTLPYLLALDGMDLLLVLAAAPGRGAPSRRDDHPETRLFGSGERWTLLARTTAFVHGVWVILANRCGVEGGVTFAGGSLIVAPDGRVVAEGAEGGPDRLRVHLEKDAVRRSRRPYSHLRDEDPAFVLRELTRRVQESSPGSEGEGS